MYELINLASKDQKTLYDDTCKRVVGDKQVLARIIKAFIREVKDLSTDDIETLIGEVNIGDFPVNPHQIHMLNSEDSIPGEDTLYYDVRFVIDINHQPIEVRIYIDIEIQNDPNPGYPLVTRGICYTSRMISKQYGVEYDGKDYSGMKKSYSVWIMPQAAHYLDGAINAYEITERQIQGEYHEKLENYDKMCTILVYLSKTHQIENKYDQYDEILTPLSLLLTNNTEASRKKDIIHKYGFKMTESFDKEMTNMCNLSDGIERDAIERTTKKVTKEVTKDVTNQKNIIHVKKLMEKYDLTVIQAMNVLEIPDVEREAILSVIIS